MLALKNWPRLAALAVFGCAVALASCKKKEAAPAGEPAPPPKPSSGGAVHAESPADLSKEKPAATFSVTLYMEQQRASLEKGQSFPNHQYSGRVIEMTGEVAGYSKDSTTGGPAILIAYAQRSALSVPCAEPRTKALPGQKATLRAWVPKYGALNWQIVAATGRVTTHAAAELAAECEKDPKAFVKEYEGRWLVVAGGVAVTLGSSVTLVTGATALSGNDGLLCLLEDEPKHALRRGANVKLVARVHPAGNSFLLENGILIEPAP